MLTGKCFCGAVQYQIDQDIDTLVFCHCSRCRRESASAYNAITVVLNESLKITEGQSAIKTYSDKGTDRHFCGNCGSQLFSEGPHAPGMYYFRVGTLTSDISPERKLHIFTGSKASWDEIGDNLPAFDEMPPQA